MTRVTVKAESLTRAAAALSRVGEDLKDEFGLAARRTEGQWRALVFSKASTQYERRLIAQGVRMAVRGGGVRLESSGGRLSRGMNTADHGGAVEYGTRREKVTTYRRGGKRKAVVRRHTARQMRQFNKTGYVFTPAVKAYVPVLKRAWVDAAAEALEAAITGKG